MLANTITLTYRNSFKNRLPQQYYFITQNSIFSQTYQLPQQLSADYRNNLISNFKTLYVRKHTSHRNSCHQVIATILLQNSTFYMFANISATAATLSKLPQQSYFKTQNLYVRKHASYRSSSHRNMIYPKNRLPQQPFQQHI